MTFLELEKACKKRRLLKLLKILFLLFLIMGVSVYTYVRFNKQTPEKMKTKSEAALEKKIKAKENSKTKENNKTQNKPIKTQVSEKPAKTEKKEHKKIKNPKPQTLTFVLDLNKTLKSNIKKVDVKISGPSSKPEKNENKPAIKTSVLPSYETCINLAEKYLKSGDYTEALQWAKNANVQNKDDARSWIVSAEALSKMNKKNEALKLLKIYYNYHKDERVKKLMGELGNER
jgi:tetratricopeptide (TPR) repeat protein